MSHPRVDMTAPPANDQIQPEHITIRVLLFSVLRERLGASQIDIPLAKGCDTSDLLLNLIETYPEIRSYAPATRLAVNEEYVDRVVDLADGDEVALITPVSGG